MFYEIVIVRYKQVREITRGVHDKETEMKTCDIHLKLNLIVIFMIFFHVCFMFLEISSISKGDPGSLQPSFIKEFFQVKRHFISMVPYPRTGQWKIPSGEAAKNGMSVEMCRPVVEIVNPGCNSL